MPLVCSSQSTSEFKFQRRTIIYQCHASVMHICWLVPNEQSYINTAYMSCLSGFWYNQRLPCPIFFSKKSMSCQCRLVMHICWLVPNEKWPASSALPCSFNTRYQSSRNFDSFLHNSGGQYIRVLIAFIALNLCRSYRFAWSEEGGARSAVERQGVTYLGGS
jgi:hypothetical protein